NQEEIFLSHSGLDNELALSLAKRIERELNIRVFNTSDPEIRFKDLRSNLESGMDWAIEARRYDGELEDYLRKALLNSKVYLLLVTRRSLQANSSWVEFEMELASKEAHQRELFFIPCVAEEELFKELPTVASQFQGVEIASEKGFRKLLDSIGRALRRSDLPRSLFSERF